MLPASLFVASCSAGAAAVEPLRVCRRPQLVWGFHCQAFPCSNPQSFHPFVRSAGSSDPHSVLGRPVRRRHPAHGSGGREARWQPRKRRMLAEVRNQADTAIYTAGKPLQEHGSRMTDAGRRKPVKEALNALRGGRQQGRLSAPAADRHGVTGPHALQRGDPQCRRHYRHAQRGGAIGGQQCWCGGSVGGRSDRVVDAKFEEVDDPQQRRQA
jgi:hypothetical protein